MPVWGRRMYSSVSHAKRAQCKRQAMPLYVLLLLLLLLLLMPPMPTLLPLLLLLLLLLLAAAAAGQTLGRR